MNTSIFDALEEEYLLLIVDLLHWKKKNAHKPEKNGCTKFWKNEGDMGNITG